MSRMLNKSASPFPPPFLIVFILLLCGGGCSTHRHSVYQFSQNSLNADVEAANRSVKLYHQFDTILILDAIRYDTTLRAAVLANRAQKKKLSDTEKEEEANREIREIGPHRRRFILALYTSEDEWNDLSRSNSRWSLRLRNGDNEGRAELVTKIAEDKLPIRDALPYNGSFRTFYYADFPATIAGDGPDILTLSGALGSVELSWD